MPLLKKTGSAKRGEEEAIPIFVFGCQRSGTNMLLETLDKSPETRVFNETNPRAFKRYRIRSLEEIAVLVGKSKAKYCVLKPICDSQWANKLLGIAPNAKAVWIYRNYFDTAESLAKHGEAEFKRVLGRVAENEINEVDWRLEKATKKTLRQAKELFFPEMARQDAAAVFWLMRNQLYFDQKLEKKENVILVKYEDLVLKKQMSFGRVFGFLGIRFENSFADKVHDSAIGKGQKIVFSKKIKKACESLQEKLDALSDKFAPQH